nr:hypothetical protein [uncultured Rhodopila sp.]
MILEQLTLWAPILAPAVTAVIGILLPSPGPAIARFSAAWWTAAARRAAAVWQSKPAQTAAAADLSPAVLSAINEAVRLGLTGLPIPAAVDAILPQQVSHDEAQRVATPSVQPPQGLSSGAVAGLALVLAIGGCLPGCATADRLMVSAGVNPVTAQKVELGTIAAGQLVCTADSSMITLPQINVIGASAAAVAAACKAAQVAGLLTTPVPVPPVAGATAVVATVPAAVAAAVDASRVPTSS